MMGRAIRLPIRRAGSRACAYSAEAWWPLRDLDRIRWTAVDQTVISGCNFLSIYLLARFMEVDEFGLFIFGWILLLFFVNLQGAIICQPHNILAASQGLLRFRQFTTVLLTVQLICSIALGLLLLLLGVLVSAVVSPTYGQLLSLLGIVLVPWTAQEFVRRVFYTRSETRAASINDGVSYGLQAAGIVLLVLCVNRPSAATAFAVLGVSSLTATFLGAWQLRNHFSFETVTLQIAGDLWKEAVSFGKWLLARNMTAWLGQYGYNWLLLAMLGPAALGTFKAAEHLLNVLNPLRLAAYSYLPPRAAVVYEEGGTPALGRWMKRVYLGVGGVFASIVVMLMLLARPLLSLAYGDKFAGLGLEWILIFGALAATITFARLPLEMGLTAMRETQPLFWISVASVVVLVAGGVVLVHFFGILGAPLVSILVGSVLLVLTHRAFARLSARHAGDHAVSLERTSASGEFPTRRPREHAGAAMNTCG
jgi:O-antigen/teichoic acid export membrane protein